MVGCYIHNILPILIHSILWQCISSTILYIVQAWTRCLAQLPMCICWLWVCVCMCMVSVSPIFGYLWGCLPVLYVCASVSARLLLCMMHMKRCLLRTNDFFPELTTSLVDKVFIHLLFVVKWGTVNQFHYTWTLALVHSFANNRIQNFHHTNATG